VPRAPEREEAETRGKCGTAVAAVVRGEDGRPRRAPAPSPGGGYFAAVLSPACFTNSAEMSIFTWSPTTGPASIALL
jgi:hypothetical protein